MTEGLDHCSRCGTLCRKPHMDLELTPDEMLRVFAQHAAAISDFAENGNRDIGADGAKACPDQHKGRRSV